MTYHCFPNGAPLGARAGRVTCILDVDARYDGAGGGEESAADTEVGVGACWEIVRLVFLQ